MRRTTNRSRRFVRLGAIGAGVLVAASIAVAAIIDMTILDFHLSGTQIGDVDPGVIYHSAGCSYCHGYYDVENDPQSTWSGSLMAQAGRDPLFFAQLTNANQDVGNVGYFCLRCHVPNTFLTGHALDPSGNTLDNLDRDGVSCHFCHAMVDPIYRPGISPAEDEAILAAMPEVPAFYGNAMFVLDPNGTRRGQYSDSYPPHQAIYSPFHASGSFCGTCHDVGNVATYRRPDGTYRYNQINQAPTTEDPAGQFPLERTYTEWKLSAFANGGVDMGGRFGGEGATVVDTCQDCHMPKATAQACYFGPVRPDVSRHDFAGAAAPVLDLIAAHYANDPDVDQEAIARARARSVQMLQLAATLELSQVGDWLNVRVFNESGHKLPTGHIEGRRVWINVKFLDSAGALVVEHGHYDPMTAELETASTTVYEMHVGLSPEAAALTGLPAGPTGHMSLADTIEKDNRIPPRGFNNATYEAGGAPTVGAVYADGQYWADAPFPVPAGAVTAQVTLYYQNTPKEYIEHLRDGNHTDAWGQTLYDLWVATGKGAPIPMASSTLGVTPPCAADFNDDGVANSQDFFDFLAAFFMNDTSADFNQDGIINSQDFFDFLAAFFAGC